MGSESFAASQHICPYEKCLETFKRSDELKEHVLLHLRCRWYCCPHCSKAFFHRVNAIDHVDVCDSHKAGEPPGEPRECFDARYPLLRVWSLGMGLPAFKSGSRTDASMVARKGVVWECARNSAVVHFGPLPPDDVNEPVVPVVVA